MKMMMMIMNYSYPLSLAATEEMACLRLFLDYHGLSLIWSWMADCPDRDFQLQKEILGTLQALPITNKTILKDSKILAMVEKWSTRHGALSTDPTGVEKLALKRDSDADPATPNSNSGTPLYDEKRNSVSSQAEEGASTMSTSESDSDAYEVAKKKLTAKSGATQPPVNLNGAEGLKPGDAARASSVDAVTEDKTQDSNVSSLSDPHEEKPSTIPELSPAQLEAMQKEIWDLARKLLDSWMYLKEVFKIPKITLRERREHEKDLDAKRQKDSTSSRSSRDQPRRPDDRRGRESTRDASSSSSAKYSSSSDRKRRHSPDVAVSSRDSPKDAASSRVSTGPTPNKLSKYEHRRLFEEKVKLEDTLRERQKMRQQQQEQQMQPPPPQHMPHPPPQPQQQPPPPMWGQDGGWSSTGMPMPAPYGMEGQQVPYPQHFMPPSGPPPAGPPPPTNNFHAGGAGGSFTKSFYPAGGAGPGYQNQPPYQEPAEPVMIPVVGEID